MTILFEKEGDIFTSSMSNIVIPVNTQGVMGAGLARIVGIRYPRIARVYKEQCRNGALSPGMLMACAVNDTQRLILFPTKTVWAKKSELEYIRTGLEKIASTYESRNITSLALPMIGCGLGDLDREVVLALIREILGPLPIDVEVYTGWKK